MTAPAVTVVVPTADRPAQLRRCLAALAEVEHPRERMEVIVVDDASRADVRAVCAAAVDLDVRVLRREERRGPGAARNAGARAADGTVLAFTDDDCRPDRGWLRALLAGLGEDGAAAAGGQTVNALTGNPYAAVSQHVQDLVYAHYNRDPRRARFLASNNLAVDRAAFLATGGFDASGFPFASEDRDLCDRLRAAGLTLRYAPGALVWHEHDLDLRGFVGQHVAYGRGAARFHAARARRGTGRLRDETSFHRDPELWRRTLAVRPPRRAAQLVALLALWQAANAAGYVLERRRLARRPAAGGTTLAGEQAGGVR